MLGKPVRVYSVTLGKYITMGFTNGDTLTCLKGKRDKLYTMGDRLALDHGGLLDAKSRGSTRVVIILDGKHHMENPMSQWLATELVRLGSGDKRENPQHTLGPQDVDTMDASLL
ncbi:hypothetical protein LCGC14_2679140 [marine sediment metagenome]|uniref:Uncharacterized protein n=1 Tax=marine sediment metagenome TaxID=412755 RepID=A0A0F9BWL4_9ZZZZ